MSEMTTRSAAKRVSTVGKLAVRAKEDVSSNVAPKKPRKRVAVEFEEDDDSQVGLITWAPTNWQQTLQNIRQMRERKDAPVDSMGCEECVDREEPPHVARFHTLVSLMLSSQTKDDKTHAAVTKLKNHGLTVHSVLATDDQTLGQLIYPVNFWKEKLFLVSQKKVQYLKRTAAVLEGKYNGDIPRSVEELCQLPGVGPKMAHICMDVAWGEVTGIGVDTHVHRIANRLQWVATPTKTPEQTRKSLESWLPRDLWREVNLLLVGFGQQICTPLYPHCNDCVNSSICPFPAKTKSGRKMRSQ